MMLMLSLIIKFCLVISLGYIQKVAVHFLVKYRHVVQEVSHRRQSYCNRDGNVFRFYLMQEKKTMEGRWQRTPSSWLRSGVILDRISQSLTNLLWTIVTVLRSKSWGVGSGCGEPWSFPRRKWTFLQNDLSFLFYLYYYFHGKTNKQTNTSCSTFRKNKTL